MIYTVLWPLLHYLVWSKATDGRAEKQNWRDYVAVNQQFANTIVAHYRQGDISKYSVSKQASLGTNRYTT